MRVTAAASIDQYEQLARALADSNRTVELCLSVCFRHLRETKSLASENASRLAAMQRADKNIDELLDELNSTFHQLRQSGIDAELFDLISGFEALKDAGAHRGT